MCKEGATISHSLFLTIAADVISFYKRVNSSLPIATQHTIRRQDEKGQQQIGRRDATETKKMQKREDRKAKEQEWLKRIQNKKKEEKEEEEEEAENKEMVKRVLFWIWHGRHRRHTVNHLFTCDARPTSLSMRDLWVNPVTTVDFLRSLLCYSSLATTAAVPAPRPPPEPPP